MATRSTGQNASVEKVSAAARPAVSSRCSSKGDAPAQAAHAAATAKPANLANLAEWAKMLNAASNLANLKDP